MRVTSFTRDTLEWTCSAEMAHERIDPYQVSPDCSSITKGFRILESFILNIESYQKFGMISDIQSIWHDDSYNDYSIFHFKLGLQSELLAPLAEPGPRSPQDNFDMFNSCMYLRIYVRTYVKYGYPRAVWQASCRNWQTFIVRLLILLRKSPAASAVPICGLPTRQFLRLLQEA